MVRIGCTGAIGAGKSTVAAMLSARGAHIVDADVLARRAVAPGTAGLVAVAARFGDGVLRAGGELDRAALAAIVFADPVARRDLESIVHPAVQEAIDAELATLDDDRVAVLDVALLVETDGRSCYGLDGVLVVDAPEELCIERLVEGRGMSEGDARARLAAQIDRGERLRAADFVIINLGTLEELEEMVDRAWAWIVAVAAERRADS
ncbi:MAG TPA: dephospho-CoA kinase [Acidimicrobiales bacterium]|nr:dephospho-CoA kinase [Acidimicrobiales bacterium]